MDKQSLEYYMRDFWLKDILTFLHVMFWIS